MEHPVAKATFVRSKNRWRIFWMRRDLKWHGYEPNLEVQSLKAFLNVVDRDEYCCFFGYAVPPNVAFERTSRRLRYAHRAPGHLAPYAGNSGLARPQVVEIDQVQNRTYDV